MSFSYPEKIVENRNENIRQDLNGAHYQIAHQLLPQPAVCTVSFPLIQSNNVAVYPITPYVHNQQQHQQGSIESNPISKNFESPRQNRHRPPPLNFNLIKRYNSNDNFERRRSASVLSDLTNGDRKGKTGVKIDTIFYELQKFTIEGCSFAESVAISYRKRPCFRKIELLLSRLGHELNIHHNILSNIKSQGTAWAIKDFIFAFTRIVNAWTIMRGYVYDKAEGLDDLRNDFEPDFVDTFTEWQKATLKMMRCLMGTIENLDVSAQNKSGNMQKKKTIYIHPINTDQHYDREFLENFQKNLFAPKTAEDSEQIQIQNHNNGLYFRSGVLKPLMFNDRRSTMPQANGSTEVYTPSTPSSTSSTVDDINVWLSADNLNESPIMKNIGVNERLYHRSKSVSLPTTPIETINNPFEMFDNSRVKKALLNKFNSFGRKTSLCDDDKEFGLEFSQLDIDADNEDNDDDALLAMYREDGMKIIYLMNEFSKIKLPSNLKASVSNIIRNIKSGKYGKFADIIAEFRNLIQFAKNAMKNADRNEKFNLNVFINTLDSILNRKAFN